MPINVDEVFGVFPKGVILAWYAKKGVFPSGWAVCDGTNDTPDLRQTFLMGVSDMADVGQTGGANSVKNWRTAPHQLTTDEMPSHTHTQQIRLHQAPEGVTLPNEYSPNFPNGNSNNWSWGGNPTGPTGGSAPHEHAIPDLDNRPLYNSVIFIMKL